MKQLYVLIPILALVLTGCVGKSTYEEKVMEAEQLSTELQSLKQNHAELQEKYSALVTSNAALQEDFDRAQSDIERLEQVLSERSIEAGEAMTEMRKMISQLKEENRELQLAVETEKIARQARVAQIQSTYDELVEKMEEEIERGEVTISELQGKLTVNMVDEILFPSGSANIKTAGRKILQRVAEIVKTVEGKDIQVEGHTDNVPISSRLEAKFPTNWELSTARAATVVRALRDFGISGERLAAVGYGPFQPVASNDTKEGKAKNRRIQIVLVPEQNRIEETLQ